MTSILYKPRPERLIRFRFGLRTVFVVVTLCGLALGWLGVQIKWLRDRRSAIEWVCKQDAFNIVRDHASHGSGWAITDMYDDDEVRAVEAPRSLRLFGETAVALIYVRVQDTQQRAAEHRQHLGRIFPEATILVDAR